MRNNEENRAEKLGQTLRRLRKNKKLTQAQLAEAIGVDESYISKIETGRLPYTPSEETIRLMAKTLDVDSLELLTLAEKVPNELQSLAGSPSAREFFELVRQRSLKSNDWEDLTQLLRHRLARREKGRR
jgi:transcriptional regulator with XRE-family HTH domain